MRSLYNGDRVTVSTSSRWLPIVILILGLILPIGVNSLGGLSPASDASWIVLLCHDCAEQHESNRPMQKIRSEFERLGDCLDAVRDAEAHLLFGAKIPNVRFATIDCANVSNMEQCKSAGVDFSPGRPMIGAAHFVPTRGRVALWHGQAPGLTAWLHGRIRAMTPDTTDSSKATRAMESCGILSSAPLVRDEAPHLHTFAVLLIVSLALSWGGAGMLPLDHVQCFGKKLSLSFPKIKYSPVTL